MNKLDELKVPYISNHIVVSTDDDNLLISIGATDGKFVAVSQESFRDSLQELIGLRVEAAHAIGMLTGYRMAMKDLNKEHGE